MENKNNMTTFQKIILNRFFLKSIIIFLGFIIMFGMYSYITKNDENKQNIKYKIENVSIIYNNDEYYISFSINNAKDIRNIGVYIEDENIFSKFFDQVDNLINVKYQKFEKQFSDDKVNLKFFIEDINSNVTNIEKNIEIDKLEIEN